MTVCRFCELKATSAGLQRTKSSPAWDPLNAPGTLQSQHRMPGVLIVQVKINLQVIRGLCFLLSCDRPAALSLYPLASPPNLSYLITSYAAIQQIYALDNLLWKIWLYCKRCASEMLTRWAPGGVSKCKNLTYCRLNHSHIPSISDRKLLEILSVRLYFAIPHFRQIKERSDWSAAGWQWTALCSIHDLLWVYFNSPFT